jgi:hypothetical protein
MQAIRIFISLLPTVLAIILGYYLYGSFGSTPVLFLVLLLIFSGVMFSFILWKNKENILSKEKIPLVSLPTPDDSLIYVSPQDFAEKAEKMEGQLAIAGVIEPERNCILTKVSYHKLLDELTLSFSPSLEIKIKGLATIGVGDYHFAVFGFQEVNVLENRKKVATLTWVDPYLTVHAAAQSKIKLEDGTPSIVFCWDEEVNL